MWFPTRIFNTSILEQVKEEGANQGYLWRSYMDMNYELNKVVLATQFGEVLEIVDLNDYSVYFFNLK
jgi:hypothetical protein